MDDDRSAGKTGFVIPEISPCPFCENMAGRGGPSCGANTTVFRDRVVQAFLNPTARGGMPGHMLVVPRRHAATILDLSADEEAALAHVVARASRTLTRVLEPDGIIVTQFNGVAAGQEIPHAHFHVIPCRRGYEGAPLPQPIEERHQLVERLQEYW